MQGVPKRPRNVNRSRRGSSWLRSWRCKVESRKVFGLTDAQYRFWDLCLCLTDAGGMLPSIDDVAFALRMSHREVENKLCELVELRFFDPIVMDGGHVLYRAHDWDDWQRQSDRDRTNARRQAKWRRRKAAKADNATTEMGVTRYVTDFCSVSVSNTAEQLIVTPSLSAVPSAPSQREISGSLARVLSRRTGG